MTEPLGPPPPAGEPEERREERPGRAPASLALGLLLAGAGVVWLLASLDALDVPAQLWIAVLLILVGVAVVALPEGARGVLIAVGIVLALVGAVASAVEVEVGGGIGERRESPSSTAELEDGYSLGVGSLRIDLTELEGPIELEASVGIGELVVTVPEDAEVVVDAHAGIGDVRALGRDQSGFDVDLEERFDGDGDGDEIRLELDVGIGSVQVVSDATL